MEPTPETNQLAPLKKFNTRKLLILFIIFAITAAALFAGMMFKKSLDQKAASKVGILANDGVKVEDTTNTWKRVSADLLTKKESTCGYLTTTSSRCIDHLFFIPKDDTFSSEGQFGVKVSVFENLKALSPHDWYIAEVRAAPLSTLTTKTDLTINNLPAVLYETNLEDDMERSSVVCYVVDIGGGQIAVLLSQLKEPLSAAEGPGTLRYKDQVMSLAQSLTTEF